MPPPPCGFFFLSLLVVGSFKQLSPCNPAAEVIRSLGYSSRMTLDAVAQPLCLRDLERLGASILGLALEYEAPLLTGELEDQDPAKGIVLA